jgi:hypothetical protein
METLLSLELNYQKKKRVNILKIIIKTDVMAYFCLPSTEGTKEGGPQIHCELG